MSDSINLRNAYVVTKEGDTNTDLRKKVDISIIGLLPMVGGDHIDGLIGASGADYGKIDEIDTPTPAEGSDFNMLFDDTDGMENRFKFLGKAKSIATKLYVDIIHDSKYNDIIIVPDLNSLGSGVNKEFNSHNTVVIEGYTVGAGEKLKKPSSDLLCNVDEDDTAAVPTAERLTSVKTMLAPIYGLEKNSPFTGNAMKMPDVANYSKRGAPLQFIVLGTNEAVFGSSKKVNAFSFLQTKPNEMRLVYVNKKEIPNIVIPLNF